MVCAVRAPPWPLGLLQDRHFLPIKNLRGGRHETWWQRKSAVASVGAVAAADPAVFGRDVVPMYASSSMHRYSSSNSGFSSRYGMRRARLLSSAVQHRQQLASTSRRARSWQNTNSSGSLPVIDRRSSCSNSSCLLQFNLQTAQRFWPSVLFAQAVCQSLQLGLCAGEERNGTSKKPTEGEQQHSQGSRSIARPFCQYTRLV